jgi:Raf kinase inhibitor-like YbhB/YbcL family protein
VPANSKTLCLILHDPDAPRQEGFTHWVLFNIDPSLEEIVENVAQSKDSAGIGVQGKNDGGKVGYMGPCPPSGRHRYIARLYALDTILTLNAGISRQEVELAMEDHILAKAALMGTYAKKVAA